MSHKSSSSKFYAYLSRLRWIKRWGLMRNAEPENVMEHSWEVAVIAHALALIIARDDTRLLWAKSLIRSLTRCNCAICYQWLS